MAAPFPFDAQFESTGGHHLTRSARAVEWAAVHYAVNQFRTTLGLRPQEQDESSHIPFIAGYSPLFSQLPVPAPTASHSISGFWRVAPETFTSSPALDAFLAAGSPPVFVGFGNSPLPRPTQPYTALATALKTLNLRGLFAAPGTTPNYASGLVSLLLFSDCAESSNSHAYFIMQRDLLV